MFNLYKVYNYNIIRKLTLFLNQLILCTQFANYTRRIGSGENSKRTLLSLSPTSKKKQLRSPSTALHESKPQDSIPHSMSLSPSFESKSGVMKKEKKYDIDADFKEDFLDKNNEANRRLHFFDTIIIN